MFCRYDLRTTDPDAAREFYSEVLGVDLTQALSPEEPSIVGVWQLHEQARARGAPAHWLGHVAVADLDASVTRFLALGSERLGPTVQAPDGSAYAALRDPSGAVVSLRTSPGRSNRSPVTWHHHHTRDLDRAWAAYSALFGWTNAGTIEASGVEGGYRMFAWDDTSDPVGTMANTARMPSTHPHWLYFFSVADIDAGIAKVRARGGETVAAQTTLPSGARVVPCHDPQGAAFGLCQTTPGA